MSTTDQNFDSHSKTFKKNIYGTGKGKIREAVLMRDLANFLDDKTNLKILDIGGGQGQIALQLAQRGHQVTITDISSEMLARAREAAESKQLTNIEFIHTPLQELSGHLAETQYDLVMCHAVFEWLEDPESAFKILTQYCSELGSISLMFYNQVGQTLSNLVYGNFDYIDAGMKGKKVVKLNPQASLAPCDVFKWVKTAEFKVKTKSGVRCFHDYMRDISMWESHFEQILAKELHYSQTEPYASIGRYMHLIISRQ